MQPFLRLFALLATLGVSVLRAHSASVEIFVQKSATPSKVRRTSRTDARPCRTCPHPPAGSLKIC
jgi:hypothetical protein